MEDAVATEAAAYTPDMPLYEDLSESCRWSPDLCISPVAVVGLAFDSNFRSLCPLPCRQLYVMTVALEVYWPAGQDEVAFPFVSLRYQEALLLLFPWLFLHRHCL